jgi:hypothetical protein
VSDDPRVLIAAEHGLDQRAARFLVGETIAELEESAIELARLIGQRRATTRRPIPSPTSSPSQPQRRPNGSRRSSTRSPAGHRRRRTSAGASSAAPSTTGFDGGAREPAPKPGPTHDQWLAAVLRHRHVDVGVRF